MQAAHDGANGGFHDFGDLLVGEPFDVGEVDGESEVFGNGLQCVFDGAVWQVVDGLGLGRATRHGCGRFGTAELPVFQFINGALVGLALLLAVRVDEGVGEDAVQPRLEVGSLLVLRERGEGLHEGLLHEVLRVGGVARHAHGRCIKLVEKRQRLLLEQPAGLLAQFGLGRCRWREFWVAARKVFRVHGRV